MTHERDTVEFGRTHIPYQVERSSRRKTATISVGASQVVVRVPTETPPAEIRQVVRFRGAWVLQKLMYFDELASIPPPPEYVNGETLAYLGRHYLLRVERASNGGRASTRLLGRFLVVEVPGREDEGPPQYMVRTAVVRWFRERASARLPSRVQRFAIQAGLEAPPVLIRDQAKRWGSCSRRGELRFNWRIIMAPMSLVDYVVAHEVCHLTVRNHSNDFWRMLGRLLPDFEARRERLRLEGHTFTA